MSVDKHHELRTRTKAFALRVIRMSEALPKTREANVIGQQILRSGTSVAANYRAAGRSRSKAEFLAKIGTVIEEADETVFWLENSSGQRDYKTGKTREHYGRSQSTSGNLCCIASDRERLNLGYAHRPRADDGDVGGDAR